MQSAAVGVCRFNRFFTQFVGALDPHSLGSELTLTEARLLLRLPIAPNHSRLTFTRHSI
jgi:hypothetical protein